MDAAKITEIRTITMIAGAHAFDVESSFKVDGKADKIKPVAGLALRNPKHRPTVTSGQFLGYWDAVMAKKHGHIGTFLINEDSAQNGYKINQSQLLKILANDLKAPVRYRVGAIWQNIDAPTALNFKQSLYQLNHISRHPITTN